MPARTGPDLSSLTRKSKDHPLRYNTALLISGWSDAAPRKKRAARLGRLGRSASIYRDGCARTFFKRPALIEPVLFKSGYFTGFTASYPQATAYWPHIGQQATLD